MIVATQGRADLTETSVGSRPLVWLNLLCLDAPIVAVLWQALFSRSFAVGVPAAGREVLFLTAWLIYLVDRLADPVSLSPDDPKALRQQFCWRHKKPWTAAIVVIALLDAGIILWRLPHRTLICGLAVGAVAVAYLVVNYAFNKIWRRIPVKEIAVGSLFAAGTLVSLAPPLWNTPQARGWAAAAAALFALVCSLNCMSIAAWERGLDRDQRKPSIATRWPGLQPYLAGFSLSLVAAAALLGFAGNFLGGLAFCLGLSAILLGALPMMPVTRDERTALADLVLFTPLLVFFAGAIM